MILFRSIVSDLTVSSIKPSSRAEFAFHHPVVWLKEQEKNVSSPPSSGEIISIVD